MAQCPSGFFPSMAARLYDMQPWTQKYDIILPMSAENGHRVNVVNRGFAGAALWGVSRYTALCLMSKKQFWWTTQSLTKAGRCHLPWSHEWMQNWTDWRTTYSRQLNIMSGHLLEIKGQQHPVLWKLQTDSESGCHYRDIPFRLRNTILKDWPCLSIHFLMSQRSCWPWTHRALFLYNRLAFGVSSASFIFSWKILISWFFQTICSSQE